MQFKVLLLNLFLLLNAPFVFADDDHDWLFRSHGYSGPMDGSTFFTGVALVAVSFVAVFIVLYFVQKLLLGLLASTSLLKYIPLALPLMLLGEAPPLALSFMVGATVKSEDTFGLLFTLVTTALLFFLYFYLLNLFFDLFSNKPYGTYTTRLLAVLAALFGLYALVKGLYLVVLLLILAVLACAVACLAYRKVKERQAR